MWTGRVLVGARPERGAGRLRPSGRIVATAALAGLLALAPLPVAAESLRQALISAYRTNPRLDAERAKLRVTDEDVSQANAGYRPRIQGNADVGVERDRTQPSSQGSGRTNPWGYSLTVTQPVFNGLTTTNAVREAEATVRAGRETLRIAESNTLLDAVAAYADVVRDQQVLKFRENNVMVLTRELEAAEARRNVREITRTDVSQARARRARAISAADLAKANLKASRAFYERVVGHPPGRLLEPPFRHALLPRTLDHAQRIAEKESPSVIAALYREQAARHAVDKIWGELLPQVRIEAEIGHRSDPSRLIQEQDSASVTGRVSVPLYDGGTTHSRVRQAKHGHVGRLQEIESSRTETSELVSATWARMLAARSQLKSDQVQVEANRTALEGVREEEKVGQRTLLDVLNAEQELLDAKVQLVSTRRDVVVLTYRMLSVVGRLSAEALALETEIYDPTENYASVRNKWFGISITHRDGRKESIEVPLAEDELLDDLE